jgi:hypothetical protein
MSQPLSLSGLQVGPRRKRQNAWEDQLGAGNLSTRERTQSMEPDQSRPVWDMARSRSLHEQQTDGHWLRANGSVLQPQSSWWPCR